MRKTIVVSILGLVCMSVFLVVIKEMIDCLNVASTMRNTMSYIALLGWVGITYKVVTLKYKWVKRIAGIDE